jgi:hypothetical protein
VLSQAQGKTKFNLYTAPTVERAVVAAVAPAAAAAADVGVGAVYEVLRVGFALLTTLRIVCASKHIQLRTAGRVELWSMYE